MGTLAYHDLITLDDPRYDDYLDLYQRSFPLAEQELVSRHNRILRARMRGDSPADVMFVAVAPDGATVGMARYESHREAGILWYLAVAEAERSAGIGAAMYAEVVRRVRHEEPEAGALVYEVEAPESVEHASEAEQACRRIRFYQRNGGFLLNGVRYVQSVGWQPPLEMRLMIHPFKPLHPDAAVRVCQGLFGSALEVVDAPALVGIG